MTKSDMFTALILERKDEDKGYYFNSKGGYISTSEQSKKGDIKVIKKCFYISY